MATNGQSGTAKNAYHLQLVSHNGCLLLEINGPNTGIMNGYCWQPQVQVAVRCMLACYPICRAAWHRKLMVNGMAIVGNRWAVRRSQKYIPFVLSGGIGVRCIPSLLPEMPSCMALEIAEPRGGEVNTGTCVTFFFPAAPRGRNSIGLCPELMVMPFGFYSWHITILMYGMLKYNI